MSSAHAVGIDLGTTNSVVAIDSDQGPRVLKNSEGRTITPSVLCFQDQEILIGAAAKAEQALGRWPVAAYFKRQMGDKEFIFPGGQKDYDATELSAILLRKLKQDAELALGEGIEQAVITVPAYFKDAERKATLEAGRKAGLKLLQVVNEPTAAAVAYGISRERGNQRLLVYDLGGGTFDITLLEVAEREIRVLTSDGDHQLGGKDWDDRIIEYVAEAFREEFGMDPLADAESLAELLILAEDAKKKLTESQSTTLTLRYEGKRGQYPFDRERFEQVTADLMERTIFLSRKVLEEQGFLPSQIDAVLLVGGSTRMPMVHRFIEREFGKPPLLGVNVDEAVALGAAVIASQHLNRPRLYLGGALKTVDVTNHSLGMIAVNSAHTAYLNSIILAKNQVIPCENRRPFQIRTRATGANTIEIFLTQGESESPADVAYLGRHLIHEVPHRTSGPAVVDIQYRYDVSGTVAIDAFDRRSGKPLRITVEALPADVPARFLVAPSVPVVEHLTVYLAFDLSGSMSGDPLRQAKKAAKSFLANLDLGHCSLGVIGFSDSVETCLKACQNARTIEKALAGLSAGQTGYGNDGDPFNEISQLMRGVKGKKVALVLADGVWSHQKRAIAAAKTCHQQQIDVVAIGFGGADHSFLKAIASSDENSFFTSQNRLVETYSSIAQVLTESSGQATSGLAMHVSGRGTKR